MIPFFYNCRGNTLILEVMVFVPVQLEELAPMQIRLSCIQVCQISCVMADELISCKVQCKARLKNWIYWRVNSLAKIPIL